VSRPLTAKRACVGGGVLLGILLFCASMITCALTIGIWPGEAKLTAPLFCPDDKPDPFVVVDSYSSSPGETSYNFSLYCMGPRGDLHEVGFLWPCVVLTAAHAALILLLIALFVVPRRLRRSRRAVNEPDRPNQPVSPIS
jgi:hypothetical protein